MPLRSTLARFALAACLLAPSATPQRGFGGPRVLPERGPVMRPSHEFHFLRMEYSDHPSMRSWLRPGWWMQDWPEAEAHFAQGIQRLTRIHTGEGRHAGLLDDGIFDYPWIYATQVGWWDLSDAETKRMREYLLRGGFLVVDDFFGEDWDAFRGTMRRVLPEQPILDVDNGHPMMRVLYKITERTQIPGLRHLRRAPGGSVVVRMPGEPYWRALHDNSGRMVVAINYNMDIGDAWEHADMPEYPEEMTGLAYRFGINYILYSMTH